jgi:aspartokinase-like uncharacterized kinase
MNYTNAIFKVGGKILEDIENLNSTISQLRLLFQEKIIQNIILIPGGGSFAKFIRKVYNELKFTEETAHWMGIISMNYNGLELKNKFPNLDVVEDFNELKKLNSNFSIFLPYEYLKENDQLPHSWDVTSDSISLFIAKELGLKECFLIKEVDGILDNEHQVIKEISTFKFKTMKESGKLGEFISKNSKLKKQTTPIDPYILTLIDKYKISCVLLNGDKKSNRILKYFKSDNEKERVYTLIK